MAKIIAYADPTGFVHYPTVNGQMSDYAQSIMTPLYSQEEIDRSMQRFYAEQGLEDGTPTTNVAPPLAQSAEFVDAAAADRAAQSKAMTGQSIAEAAASALGTPPPPPPKL